MEVKRERSEYETLIHCSEMKSLRSIPGCLIKDKIRNDFTRIILEVIPIMNKIENYRRKWKNHLESMDYDRMLKADLNIILEEKETEEGPETDELRAKQAYSFKPCLV